MGTLGGIPLEVGDVLAKKYRLEALVGEGGTGVVVAARHLQLDRPLAIKFLRTALANDEVRLRFEREARAIQSIESDHVVTVIDVGALPDGEPFMVMEFLEGRDLARVLKEDGPLTVEDAIDCMLQVCDALASAHANGIVHRDLKPANLFLTRREDGGPHVKVVDFGISKILDKQILDKDKGPKEMTAAFEVLGSPRYMAPEQLRNSKDVDHRADLWSVGAVLFQILTGKHAFDAESNVQASLKVMTGEPQSLATVAPWCPPDIVALVKRCLTRDVTKRFQSAAELANELRPYASDRTRDSLERMEEAREAPNINISLQVQSLTPPSLDPARPIEDGLRDFLEESIGDEDIVKEEKEETTERRRPSADLLAATRPEPATLPPKPLAEGLTPALHPPSSPSMPASLDGGLVSSSRRTSALTSPTRGMKIGLAIGGVVLVLVIFGALTAIKAIARSLGPNEASSIAVPASAPPAVTARNMPSEPVTAPPRAVLLDAGRSPP